MAAGTDGPVAPEEPLPRRGRPRAVSDEMILDAALDAFGRRGFNGVSMRDLNRSLGMSHAMLAKRFGTKEALWEAAVGRAFASHRAAVLAALADAPPADDDLARLRAGLVAFVRSAADHPDLQRVINHEACEDSWRVEVIAEQFMEPLLSQVRVVIDRLVEAGTIRPVTSREILFLAANGAASVFALAPLSERFDATDGPLDVDRYADSVADVLIAGIRRA